MAKAAQLGKVPSPLAPLKQTPRIDLVLHGRELVASAVCDDNVAAGLKGLRAMHNLATEEPGASSVGS